MKNFFDIQTTEHIEQVNFVRWFRLQYPGVVIFAIPNGGQRHKATAAKLKAEGVVAGVPDIFIPAWAIWIEMKKPGGKVTDSQATMKQYLEGCGYTVYVCYGFDDARKVIQNANNNHAR
jgi:hypothetical protein